MLCPVKVRVTVALKGSPSQNPVVISLTIQNFRYVFLTFREGLLITVTSFSQFFVLFDEGLGEMTLTKAVWAFFILGVGDIWHHFKSRKPFVEPLDNVEVHTAIIFVEPQYLSSRDTVTVRVWREEFKLLRGLRNGYDLRFHSSLASYSTPFRRALFCSWWQPSGACIWKLTFYLSH